MAQQKEIWEMADEAMPGQPGSPTKAEVKALFNVYQGKPIPENVREAVLLTTNGHNRPAVVENIETWNKTANAAIPEDNKRKIGQDLTLNNLATAFSERSRGFIDTSKLTKLNLQIALEAEITKAIK